MPVLSTRFCVIFDYVYFTMFVINEYNDNKRFDLILVVFSLNWTVLLPVKKENFLSGTLLVWTLLLNITKEKSGMQQN